MLKKSIGAQEKEPREKDHFVSKDINYLGRTGLSCLSREPYSDIFHHYLRQYQRQK